jgi:hypothetical protein
MLLRTVVPLHIFGQNIIRVQPLIAQKIEEERTHHIIGQSFCLPS